MNIVVLKTGDSATPFLDLLAGRLTSREAHEAMAESATVLVQDHLREKGQTPNQLGGERTFFYQDAARSTTSEADDEAGYVNIAKVGIRQRLKGGTIRPKNARALTIPVHPLAHGHRASDFAGRSQLIVFGGQGGTRAIGIIVLTGEGTPAPVLFVLASSVTQKADPTVLPTDEQLAGAALDGVTVLLEEIGRDTA